MSLPSVEQIASGSRLYGRLCWLVVGDTEIATLAPGLPSLRVAFSVTKTLKPEPNKAEIKIWNLADSTRKKIEQAEELPIQLDVGYNSGQRIETLFIGSLRKSFTRLEDQDKVTTITSGDGEKAHGKARINASYPPGATALQVVKDCAAALGMTTATLDAQLSSARMLGTSNTQLTAGLSLSGNAARELTGMLASLGFRWSRQNGALQLLAIKESLGIEAVVLSSETGLLGSPSIDNKGVLKASSLLINDILPGRIVVIESMFVRGAFRCEAVKYTGDTHGDSWTCEIEGKRW